MLHEQYLKKYVLKRQKLRMDEPMPIEEATRLVNTVAVALNEGSRVVDALAEHHADVDVATRHAIAAYAKGLYAAGRTNIGLSHAKAREYWIYRGPRQLLTTICFIGAVLVVAETALDRTLRDRIVSISTSLLALLTAFVMLYYRLPDSIRAGVCRSAHDYYVEQKAKLKPSRAADAAVAAIRDSVGDTAEATPDAASDQSEDESYRIKPRKRTLSRERSESGNSDVSPKAPTTGTSPTNRNPSWPGTNATPVESAPPVRQASESI